MQADPGLLISQSVLLSLDLEVAMAQKDDKSVPFILVHVVLDDAVWKDAEQRQAVVDQVLRIGNGRDLNEKRLGRFGILTCIVDEATLDDVRGIAGVKTVDKDQVRRLSE